MSEIPSYDGVERRSEKRLSSGRDRTGEILSFFERAHQRLKDGVRGDADDSCNFRETDLTGSLINLFQHSAILAEEEAVGAQLVSGGSAQVVREEFSRKIESILADIPEVLIREGLMPELEDVPEVDAEFVEGSYYRMTVLGKEVLARCLGFTDSGKYYSGNSPLPDGVPTFGFRQVDSADPNFSFETGREYQVSDGEAFGYHGIRIDCVVRGYTKDGQPVAEILRCRPAVDGGLIGEVAASVEEFYLSRPYKAGESPEL